jgi:hypothetical protein
MSSDFTNHSENPDDLKHVEQTLAALAPRHPQLDRDRLMFLAGAASGGQRGQETGDRGQIGPLARASRPAWVWPAASAALAATSLALAIALFVRPQPQVQIVYRDRPAAEAFPAAGAAQVVQAAAPRLPAEAGTSGGAFRPADSLPSVPANNYVHTREVALRMGVDALGTSRTAGTGSPGAKTYFDWLADISSPPPHADRPPIPRSPNM